LADRPIEISDLYVGYKTYRGISKVLNGVHLTVDAGEKIGIIGESGCGKTTTMKTILQILPTNAMIQGGEVHFRSKNVLRMSKKELNELRRKHMAMIFQDPTAALNPVFKIETQLIDIIKSSEEYEVKKKEDFRPKCIRLLKEVALPDPERVLDSYPFQLSGGMRQRVSLACAIVHNPPLLFLDEPTVGLDPELRVTFWEHFSSLTDQGITIIISSHTMDDAAHCDRLAFMREGRFIAGGTPDELRKATGQAEATLEDAFIYFIHREDSRDS